MNRHLLAPAISLGGVLWFMGASRSHEADAAMQEAYAP